MMGFIVKHQRVRAFARQAITDRRANMFENGMIVLNTNATFDNRLIGLNDPWRGNVGAFRQQITQIAIKRGRIWGARVCTGEIFRRDWFEIISIEHRVCAPWPTAGTGYGEVCPG